MKQIAVLDYGVGNLKSIMNALATLPCKAVLTKDPNQIAASDKVILPGVGAFAYCMEQLQTQGLAVVVKQLAAEGKALLGICVGMQMLFDSSEEYGEHAGLSIIPGVVKKLPITTDDNIRLPHIGWNKVEYKSRQNNPVFAELPSSDQYYFVHSYACYPQHKGHCFGETHYADVAFTSSVLAGSVCGVQYHPERSGKAGLALLRNFVCH